jgi:hypothetical protein
MTQEQYALAEDEIRSLLSGVTYLGAHETYSKMKERMLSIKENFQNIDEMCMDMHGTMLDRARAFDCEDSDKEGQIIKQTLFQIASMFRILAHELHYSCKNKQKNTKRFLELISINQGIYTYQPK